jgi:hypothetical protein
VILASTLRKFRNANRNVFAMQFPAFEHRGHAIPAGPVETFATRAQAEARAAFWRELGATPRVWEVPAANVDPFSGQLLDRAP